MGHIATDINHPSAGVLIYVAYRGAVQFANKEQAESIAKGATLKADDCYFITAPTLETKSEKYAWLNSIQAVGKMIAVKGGEGAYVRYDIVAVK